MRQMITLLLILPMLAMAKESAWFNSGMNNRDITFSPDGKMMLTTIMAPKNLHSMIVMSVKENGMWTPLKTAPFSGKFPDIEPAFSPDGSDVYFASKRPSTAGEEISWDIWRVSYEQVDNTWGDPENLGSSVNSSGSEFYPSLTRDGVLYFTATRDDSLGKEDLYRSVPNQDGAYEAVENIGAPVNTAAYEFNAFIDPDERYLIFGSQGRGSLNENSEIGGGDLYISFRRGDVFQDPILLPAPINTQKLDYCPTVFNNRLYFTSELPDTNVPKDMRQMSAWYESPGNGLGDIYFTDMEKLLRQLSEL